MNKPTKFITGMLLLATAAVFAEGKERVTYYDLETESTKTVNAVFIGWGKGYVRKDGNYIKIFGSRKFELPKEFNVKNDWSAYEYAGTNYSTASLREMYDIGVGLYHSGKPVGYLGSMPFSDGEMTMLQVDAILPGSGNSSPYWWSLDGRLLYNSYKMYIVVP
jgi:hypothetical protein